MPNHQLPSLQLTARPWKWGGWNTSVAGFAIITWNNPKIGKTRDITNWLATCQSLGAQFSHVTFGAYDGPRPRFGMAKKSGAFAVSFKAPPNHMTGRLVDSSTFHQTKTSKHLAEIWFFNTPEPRKKQHMTYDISNIPFYWLLNIGVPIILYYRRPL